MLLRETMGEALRRHRLDQDRTLRDVSADAAVSLGYLSEVERGKKEASSELLEAICDALDVPIAQLLREVSDELSIAALDDEAAAVLTGSGAPDAELVEGATSALIEFPAGRDSGASTVCLAA